jgi:hypothetical protein
MIYMASEDIAYWVGVLINLINIQPTGSFGQLNAGTKCRGHSFEAVQLLYQSVDCLIE